MTIDEAAAEVTNTHEVLTKTLLAEIANQRDIITHLQKKAVADNAMVAALELEIESIEDDLANARDEVDTLQADCDDADLDITRSYDEGYADGEEAADRTMDRDKATRVLVEVLEDIQRYKPLYDHFINKDTWCDMVNLVGGEAPNYRIPMYDEG